MEQTALVQIFSRIIVANELSNNIDFILRFSDPDGVRSGKSGWSFGRCQFDVANNPVAASCLRACGFTAEEIAGVKAQSINVHALEYRLKANAATVEKFDDVQFAGCIGRAQAILSKRGIKAADDAAVLAVADYANQYYLSDIDSPGYLVHYLLCLTHAFTAKDVLDFKLDCTPYGHAHPDDCRRRYNNLIDIVAKG